jgi:hypothetical protein
VLVIVIVFKIISSFLFVLKNESYMKFFSLFCYLFVPSIGAYLSHMSSRILSLSTRLVSHQFLKVVKPVIFTRNHVILRATLTTTNNKNLGLSEDDTVVSRCEHKISQLLKPSKIKVTSTNDDPNGSHVRFFSVFCGVLSI